ncbi:MAG: nuclear transport factor 2 family protein [Sphingomonadales bacterium]|nr:nuclear transport factor 2 family protein [Sphingomonadales bacterium]
MSDREDIQDVVTQYSIGCSRRDWELVTGLFLEDGEWCAAGATIKGRAALGQAMPAFLAKMAYFVQMNAPAVIRIDGDRATAESTIREMGKFIDKDEAFECLGWYVDELVRTAEGWKFARKTFTAAGTHQVLLAAGPASIV